MPGYKHPCRYCGILVAADSNVCPICGRKSPLDIRCPKCHSPIEKGWKRCPTCGLELEIKCPICKVNTFFDVYCEFCEHEMVVTCQNKKCKHVQPPVGDKCIKCGKPLK